MASFADFETMFGEASSTSDSQTTVELCTTGDVALAVEHKRFIGSSEILKFSSDYFKALLSPKFQEGQVIQKEGFAEIVLHDDDPEVMEMILSILHHRSQPFYYNLQPQMILSVAQHSDKYQCNEPLRPWIMQWLQKVPKGGSVQEYDCLLTAAHIFGAKEHLKAISVEAIRALPQDFKQHELFLPQEMQDELVKQMKDTVEDIRYEIESLHDVLRDSTPFYVMMHQQQVCIPCHRVMPYGANKCHPCRNSNLESRRCTNRTRSTDYLDFLGLLGLWPTRTAFNTWSVADIAEKLHDANRKYVIKCSGGEACPLKVVLKDLDEKVQEIVNEGIKGL